MDNLPREIQRFLYGQHFADGFRMTLLILLPAVAASFSGYQDAGLSMSIGALCVSICDIPGPSYHKRNGMLICCAFIFVVSLLTGFLRMNVFVMGASLTAMAFFFAMFTMYGLRAGLLGTSMLLLMALQMDKELEPTKVVRSSLLLTSGALWYSAVSILILSLFPLAAARRALGECIRESAAYLKLRGALYDPGVPLELAFTRLMAQQIILNDKQNEARELLFKNKKIISQSTRGGRAMVLTFDAVVDLYERISASHIDYEGIRERYAHTDLLADIRITLFRLAEMLDRSGAAIQYDIAVKEKADASIVMSALADTITYAAEEREKPLLDGLLFNIQNMYKVVSDLDNYFTDDFPLLSNSNRTLEHTRFVSHQDFDPGLLRYNLSFDSLTFRHAVRMSLACLTGYIIARFLMHGHHSYWLLITIIFVLKPAFSLTRERNIQRISGTLIGGIIGVLALVFIHSNYALFCIMFFSMLMTYSFQRHRYIVAMIFMTPYILILFHFMHVGLSEVAEERVADTIIGSIVALIAGYLILPDWESDQIRGYMKTMLHANFRYLRSVRDSLAGVSVSVTDYKLIRKEVYVSMSNLSAAVQRMLSEPRRTRKNIKEIQKFSMLNHLLSSNIASAKSSISTAYHSKDLLLADTSLDILDTVIRDLNGAKDTTHQAIATTDISTDHNESANPFEAICRTCSEIRQITHAILS